jgi:4a-hydroxytetrahydrobiopterin dehydratase
VCRGQLSWLYQSESELVSPGVAFGQAMGGAEMTDKLTQMKCSVCYGDGPPLLGKAIDELLLQVPEWNLVEWDGVKHLERTFKFHSFAQALAFTDDVEKLAMEERCEPVTIFEADRGWVTVTWWTDKIMGLHQNDFIMAAKTDVLYSSNGWSGKHKTG